MLGLCVKHISVGEKVAGISGDGGERCAQVVRHGGNQLVICPSGGFLTLGILLLIVNGIVKYIGKRKQMKARGEIA